MVFDNIKGNAGLKERLERAVVSGNISHAYIFDGANEDILNEFAVSFTMMLLCDNNGCGTCRICRKIRNGNHTDVFVVEPEEGHDLLDGLIEDLQKQLMRKPLEGKRNVAIVKQADTMTERAQNRLLKTLEEPLPGTVLILLTNNAEILLQTIRSRCVHYRIDGNDYEPSPQAMEKAEKMEALMYNGELFYIMKGFADELAKDKELTVQVLDGLQRLYRDMLLSGDNRYSPDKLFQNIDIIEETKRRIGRNVKTSGALKYMMIKIGG